LNDSFLDNEESKELKAILKILYDKVEDTIGQKEDKVKLNQL
jgi:hypothetical protein